MGGTHNEITEYYRARLSRRFVTMEHRALFIPAASGRRGIESLANYLQIADQCCNLVEDPLTPSGCFRVAWASF
jgi:hypothetical protein